MWATSKTITPLFTSSMAEATFCSPHRAMSCSPFASDDVADDIEAFLLPRIPLELRTVAQALEKIVCNPSRGRGLR